MRRIAIVILWLSLLVIAAAAQSNPKTTQPALITSEQSTALTDAEQKAVSEAVQARALFDKRFQQASNAALNAPTKCPESTEVLSELQVSFAFRTASQSKFEALLSEHRLKYKCAECEYSNDLKALIRKPVTAP